MKKALRPRQLRILQALWQNAPAAPISRRDLHRLLHSHPNLVGRDVKQLIAQRMVREKNANPTSRGRPSIPLEIDPDSRHVIGLALAPGFVEIARVSLKGERIGKVRHADVGDANVLVREAGSMLSKEMGPNTIAIGVSATGLYDDSEHSLLVSSAFPGQQHVSLTPILKAAKDRVVRVRNDMHAVAARWVLSPQGAIDEDVLIVSLEDGRVGAAMLMDGYPNRGCLVGGNELGHSRFAVETDRCFCGHIGCLERIFSTEFLRKSEPNQTLSLKDSMLTDISAGSRVEEIILLLAQALSNAINFIRPHRVVLMGTFAADNRFTKNLEDRLVPMLLEGLAKRVRIESWPVGSAGAGETAAWLALTEYFIPSA